MEGAMSKTTPLLFTAIKDGQLAFYPACDFPWSAQQIPHPLVLSDYCFLRSVWYMFYYLGGML
jgi:hypothetical protein